MGKLLLAGLLPGLVSVLIYASLIVGVCVAKPELGRPTVLLALPEVVLWLPRTMG